LPQSISKLSSQPQVDEDAIDNQQKASEGDKSLAEAAVQDASSLLQANKVSFLTFYQNNKKQLTLGALLALALSLIGFLSWRLRKARLSSSAYKQQLGLASSIKALEGACKQNDLGSAMAALPVWAERIGIYPGTLAGIESVADEQLSLAIQQMAAANYSPNPEAWNGKALLSAVKQYSIGAKLSPVDQAALAPLHPV
jgi:hypothetical protein